MEWQLEGTQLVENDTSGPYIFFLAIRVITYAFRWIIINGACGSLRSIKFLSCKIIFRSTEISQHEVFYTVTGLYENIVWFHISVMYSSTVNFKQCKWNTSTVLHDFLFWKRFFWIHSFIYQLLEWAFLCQLHHQALPALNFKLFYYFYDERMIYHAYNSTLILL